MAAVKGSVAVDIRLNDNMKEKSVSRNTCESVMSGCDFLWCNNRYVVTKTMQQVSVDVTKLHMDCEMSSLTIPSIPLQSLSKTR